MRRMPQSFRCGSTVVLQVALRRSSSQSAPRSILESREFLRSAPHVLLLCQIERSSKAVVSDSEFGAIASSCNVTDVNQSASALCEAGIIVKLNDGGYHLKPAQLVADMTTRAEGSSWNFEAPLEQVHRSAVDEEQKMRHILEPAIHQASKTRQAIWGCALLFSGAQLAIISRLTYFDLDWDIMEPVSYFIGTGTALVFYLYMLWYRREHSYTEFDKTHLPKWLKRKAAPTGFDWSKYQSICEQVDSTKRAVDEAKEWARQH